MRRVLAKFSHQLSWVNIPLFASGGKFRAGFYPLSKADQSWCRGACWALSTTWDWGSLLRLRFPKLFRWSSAALCVVRGKRWGPPGVGPRQPSEASLPSCLQKNLSAKCLRKITSSVWALGAEGWQEKVWCFGCLLHVNLCWLGKHKALFLPCFLCPVNLPFLWGKITKALQDPSRQEEGFGKKKWASPHWMGQYFVISYLSAVLVLYCQAIWMPPGLMCLFSYHSKGSWEYLSSFPGAELRLSDTFKVTQKICDGVRNWSL